MSLKITQEDFMSEEQVRKLKKTLKEASKESLKKNNKVAVRDWMIIHIALDSGLRASEIANLRIRDLLIHQGQSSIIVRSGKGDKKRGVSIGKDLKNHLIRFLEWKEEKYQGTNDDDWLFISPDRKSVV